MLTREQCTNLAKIGLEQTIKWDSEYYIQDHKGTWSSPENGDLEYNGYDGLPILKLPSSDDLEAFVILEGDEVWGCVRDLTVRRVRTHNRVSQKPRYVAIMDGFGEDGEMIITGNHPSRSHALYELAMKLSEMKKEAGNET